MSKISNTTGRRQVFEAQDETTPKTTVTTERLSSGMYELYIQSESHPVATRGCSRQRFQSIAGLGYERSVNILQVEEITGATTYSGMPLNCKVPSLLMQLEENEIAGRRLR